jgi:hypothetical protein
VPDRGTAAAATARNNGNSQLVTAKQQEQAEKLTVAAQMAAALARRAQMQEKQQQASISDSGSTGGSTVVSQASPPVTPQAQGELLQPPTAMLTTQVASLQSASASPGFVAHAAPADAAPPAPLMAALGGGLTEAAAAAVSRGVPGVESLVNTGGLAFGAHDDGRSAINSVPIAERSVAARGELTIVASRRDHPPAGPAGKQSSNTTSAAAAAALLSSMTSTAASPAAAEPDQQLQRPARHLDDAALPGRSSLTAPGSATALQQVQPQPQQAAGSSDTSGGSAEVELGMQAAALRRLSAAHQELVDHRLTIARLRQQAEEDHSR